MDDSGTIVSRGRNLRVQTGDPTAHAEVVAIRCVPASSTELPMSAEKIKPDWVIFNIVTFKGYITCIMKKPKRTLENMGHDMEFKHWAL